MTWISSFSFYRPRRGLKSVCHCVCVRVFESGWDSVTRDRVPINNEPKKKICMDERQREEWSSKHWVGNPTWISFTKVKFSLLFFILHSSRAESHTHTHTQYSTTHLRRANLALCLQLSSLQVQRQAQDMDLKNRIRIVSFLFFHIFVTGCFHVIFFLLLHMSPLSAAAAICLCGMCRPSGCSTVLDLARSPALYFFSKSCKSFVQLKYRKTKWMLGFVFFLDKSVLCLWGPNIFQLRFFVIIGNAENDDRKMTASAK